MFGCRDALTGDERFVDFGFAPEHDAVRGHPVARTADDDVAGLQGMYRRIPLRAVRRTYPRGNRPDRQQFPNRPARAAARPAFDVLADEYEGNDDRGGFEVELARRAGAQAVSKVGAVRVGRSGSQGHQDVHVRAAAAQRVESAPVVTGADADLQHGRERRFRVYRHVPVETGPAPQQPGQHLQQEGNRHANRDDHGDTVPTGLSGILFGLVPVVLNGAQPVPRGGHGAGQRVAFHAGRNR